MPIEFVPHDKIDFHKWDNCINTAANSLIYACSFYLDLMAENWDALVMNDYEAVIPLTYRKKFGIRYLYQPAFIQQGGIFFLYPLTDQQQQAFIHEAYKHFRFAEITLNHANDISDPPFGKITKRMNHVLLLDKPYESIFKNYDTIAVKNLKRAKNAELSFSVTNDYMYILENYEKHYIKRLPSFSKMDFVRFAKICDRLFDEQKLIIREVKNADGQPVAGSILLSDSRRIYNIISYVNDEGKLAQANYYLYDQLLKEFSESGVLLDFEGSDVSGIAEFYKRFAPLEETYPFLKYNNLPPLIKLLKP